MRGRSLALLFILASLAASLGPAAPARAAFGDLSFQGCLSAGSVAGCTAVREGGLKGPEPLAVSSDGRSVHVVGSEPGTVAHLTRAADGSLSFESCLTREHGPGVESCAEEADLVLGFPSSIVVSPGGGSIYTSGREGSAVSHFFRASPLGRPAYDGCVASEVAVCEFVEGNAMQSAGGLAIDPQGEVVYAVSPISDTLVELDRVAAAGQIAFAGCFADSDVLGCLDQVPSRALDDPAATAVSPDGKSVYVAGSEAIVWFDRDALGELRYLGCFANTGVNDECNEVPTSPLKDLTDVLVSPDGNSLYVVSETHGAILRFVRPAQGGPLAYAGCFASDDAAGCTELPGTPLEEPRSLAISPDGGSIYVADPGTHAIAHFRRGGGGELAYRGCVSQESIPNAGCAVLPARVMEAPFDLAVSPDGASVYVTGETSHTVVSFTRSLLDPPPPGGDPPPPPRPTARCAGKPATIVGTPRADTLRGTPRRDVIAGLGGADQIRGLGGKDLICGGKGKDTILGGSGEDRCLGGPGADEADCERGRGRRG